MTTISPTANSRSSSPSRSTAPSPGFPASTSSSTITSHSDPSKPKRSNPLVDLIDSEKEYVGLLAGIIRKVAGAWSQANLPPKQLDTMFRGIETVYRANRALLTQLKEIGPNPSSPKALGDLLMRWIDDLDAPYTQYCTTYMVAFDNWTPAQSNVKLRSQLEMMSSTSPPPESAGSSIWTLDSLFALPRLRLKYYKKLYARLLKSTQPGRSDHRLLVGANERLDSLLDVVNERLNTAVGEAFDSPTAREMPPPPPPSKPTLTPEPSVAKPLPDPKPLPTVNERIPSLPPHLQDRGLEDADREVGVRTSQASSLESSRAPGSSVSSGDRFSRDTMERLSGGTGNTSFSTGRSPSAMSATHPPSGLQSRSRSPMPPSQPSSPNLQAENPSEAAARAGLMELETRLDTARVLDIFTMKPKPCKLQMSKPNPAAPLSFVRTLRFEADALIAFTPRATGVEVVYKNAHVIMLSDLFLICERMGADAVTGSEEPSGTQDMWLLFPPLAARHLLVLEDSPLATDTTLLLQIMKKETLVIHVESREMKDQLSADFKDSINHAASLVPTPRVAPLNPNFPPQAFLNTNGGPSQPISPRSSAGDMSLDHRGPSPIDRMSSASISPRNSETGLMQPFSRIGINGPPPSTFIPPPRSVSVISNGGIPPPPNNHSHPFPHQPIPQYPPHPNGFPLGPGPRPGMGPPGPFGPGGFPMQPGPGGFPPPRPLQDPSLARRPSPGPMGMPANPYPPGPNGYPMYSPGGVPPPGAAPGPRPNMLRKSPSGRSLGSNSVPSTYQDQPPMPPQPPRGPPNDFGPGRGPPMTPISANQPDYPRAEDPLDDDDDDDNDEPRHTGPVTSTISATMKCKVFLQQQHAQWKSLGSARLKLYEQQPTNIKQLVVETDSKNAELLISTIVLTDGVERVGRTGVAIELSDKGARTGIVYMIQLRNEKAAVGLFDTLLAGSDRSAVSK